MKNIFADKNIKISRTMIISFVIFIFIVIMFIVSINNKNKNKPHIITNQYGIDMFVDEKGNYIYNTWVEYENYWYHINDIGEVDKNKFVDNDYYVGPNGRMFYSYWLKKDVNKDDIDEVFYFGSNGAMLKNVMVNIEGSDYCFNDKGYMITNNFFYDPIENRLVYCTIEGKVKKTKGFININGLFYYNDEYGNIVANTWVEDEGKEYYLGDFGLLSTNTWVDGQYYVNENGEKLKNTFAPDGTKLDENGNIIWENVISKQLANMKINSYYTFGNYEQDDNVDNGKEHIEWKILAKDGTKALLYTRYIIDYQKYNDESVDTTWENSTLRDWLNNDFYDNAFSDVEKNLIVEVNNENIDNQQFKTKGGSNTNDKVFLLSIDECNKYFGKSLKDNKGYNVNKKLATTATKYAINKGIDINDTTTWANGNSSFWLRSPGLVQNFASGVDAYGDVDSEGGNDIITNKHGIRIAVWVKY